MNDYISKARKQKMLYDMEHGVTPEHIKNQRRGTRLILAFVIAFFVTAIIATIAKADGQWRDGFADYIVEDNSSTVVEAMFTQPASLWVSVRDNGSNRDGLADYICIETNAAGRSAGDRVTVTIFDAAAMARDEMKKLGKKSC